MLMLDQKIRRASSEIIVTNSIPKETGQAKDEDQLMEIKKRSNSSRK